MPLTMVIFPLGSRVKVTSGPLAGYTGRVRAHSRLGTDNRHIVDFDNPTEQKVDAKLDNGKVTVRVVPFEESPFSGPYGDFDVNELTEA